MFRVLLSRIFLPTPAIFFSLSDKVTLQLIKKRLFWFRSLPEKAIIKIDFILALDSYSFQNITILNGEIVRFCNLFDCWIQLLNCFFVRHGFKITCSLVFVQIFFLFLFIFIFLWEQTPCQALFSGIQKACQVVKRWFPTTCGPQGPLSRWYSATYGLFIRNQSQRRRDTLCQQASS